MSKDYNETLNLPKTDFSMRANLPNNEPDLLSYWDSINLYGILSNKSGEKFELHDGPPFANGKIHIGHCLNKNLFISWLRIRFILVGKINGYPNNKKEERKDQICWCQSMPFSMEQRSMRANYATLKDAQIKLRKEECASGMGQRSNDAAVMDAQVLLKREECA